jgi:O-antigen biosynthesis protein
MRPETSISILICSRNRPEALCKAVRSIFAARQPDARSVQLVVVASNCPATGEMAHGLRAEAPQGMDLVVCCEARPGKSRAVNRGLQSCTGDLVAFTDDDVVVDPGWIEGVFRGFAETDADALQGRVCLRLLAVRPRWWSRHCEALLASTVYLDAQPAPVILRDLNGCNMAARMAAIVDVGPFNELLGPGAGPGHCLMGEDTEWSTRLANRGHKILYWPGAPLLHEIPADRASLPGLLRRAHLGGLVEVATSSRSIKPRESVVRMVLDGIRLVQYVLTARWPEAADRGMALARQAGILRGLLRPGGGPPARDA